MEKVEIRNFSTSLQLDICQVSAVIFHILQANSVLRAKNKASADQVIG